MSARLQSLFSVICEFFEKGSRRRLAKHGRVHYALRGISMFGLLYDLSIFRNVRLVFIWVQIRFNRLELFSTVHFTEYPPQYGT